MRPGKSLTLTSRLLCVGLLVLAGVISNARPALAQARDACPLPAGVTPPPDPRVTAQQVENGSASLMDFVLAARDQYRALSRETRALEGEMYFGCLLRQEASPHRSGSTFLVSLTHTGRVFVHAKTMALSGRQLNPSIYRAIVQALGNYPIDFAKFTAVAAGNGGPFNLPDFPGASGYATVYMSASLGIPIVLLAGFDLNSSHVVEEDVDYGDPAITAREVVDRATLKAYVTEAGNFITTLHKSPEHDAASIVKLAFRDPTGPWRHGSIYLYVLDLTNDIILFHAGLPDRYEFKPLMPTARDVITGKLILPQVLEAARSSPEGGFVEYHFDDPDDDADSADIPKVGYARTFTALIPRPDGTEVPLDFVVGSGFYKGSTS